MFCKTSFLALVRFIIASLWARLQSIADKQRGGIKRSPYDVKAAVIYAPRIASQAAAHDGAADLVGEYV
jgi:hypothetical protein